MAEIRQFSGRAEGPPETCLSMKIPAGAACFRRRRHDTEVIPVRRAPLPWLAALCAAVLCLGLRVPARAAENPGPAESRNRFNVVFATDESGSMDSTDPEALRYEAIRRFVALAANEGNFMGSVSFSGDITGSQNVAEVAGTAAKNAFVDAIAQSNPDGYTNIGLALDTAISDLDVRRNPDLDSVIILLSDGNTEMPDQDQLQESLELKADAIERARQAGYRIYTVILNTGSGADAAELEQIASATGGEFAEVSSPEDLKTVQTMFYRMIFNAAEEPEETVTVGESGSVSTTFEVPGAGVEEVNVLIEGEITGCDLQTPGGRILTEEELSGISLRGRDFWDIKVASPEGGTWTATVYGNPGATVTVKMYYNSMFYIRSSIDPASDWSIGDTVTFRAEIYDHTGLVGADSQMENVTAAVHVNCAGAVTDLPMTWENGAFTAAFTIENEGTYYADITASNGRTEVRSEETYTLNVNNREPVPAEELPSAHANIWPFAGGSASLDLEGTATDPDGEPLTYTIVSSAFVPEDYTLEGTKLTVHHYSVSRGSFTIQATDPHGAFCTYDVRFTSTSIGLVMALLMLLGCVAALVVLFIIARKLAGTPFMGTITVERYDEGDWSSSPSTIQPRRGKIRVEAFGCGLNGLPEGSYFQAGGKKGIITFVSRKPVYTETAPGPVKKVVIDGSGLEVHICCSEELDRGLTVSFRSMVRRSYDYDDMDF